MKFRLEILPALLLLTAATFSADEQPVEAEVTSHVLRPGVRKLTPELLGKLKVPQGFKINVFAQGLKNPRMMVVAPVGTVYVTQPEAGQLTALKDENGDGVSDSESELLRGMAGVHGIALREGKLYLATPKEVYVAEIQKDGDINQPEPLIVDLPEGGQHPYRTISFGPDGNFYVSIGSTCNACPESNPEHATILQVSPDWKSRKIFASGLRNTIGFGWHPDTGEMWGFDHGSDWLGDNTPPEELNKLEDGAFYGWPFLYGNNQIDPSQLIFGREKMEKARAGARPPVLTYTPHSAPIAMVFYSARQFPAEYSGDAFVAMRGSWNRQPPSGYEVVRVRFEDGQPRKIELFLSGFLIEDGKECFGRPAGLAVAKDGSLLLSDDTNGVIYRISYDDKSRRAEK